MSSNRGRSLNRRSAEQVLRGDHAAGGPALRALLTAAAAPAREGELDGEHAAMAAFRAARPFPDPRPRRRTMIKIALAKLLTTKAAVAAAATAAVAVGGVATVATTTGLPHTGGGAPASSSASAAPTTSATGKSSAARDSDTAEHHEPGAAPSPSLTGLCHAYTAGAGSEHGKALENPAFTFLINTAGGKDKVDAYCDNLLASDQNPGKDGDNGNNNGHDNGGTATATPDNDHNGQTHATQDPGAHAAEPTHPSH